MNTKTVAGIAIALWLLSAVVIGVLFVRGQTQPASDGRTAILMSEEEKNLVLAEMRGMLASVQGVVDGLATGKPEQVAAAARASGSATAATVPPTLVAKLPLDFKQLAMVTHQGFDELVVGAEQEEPGDMMLERLAGQMTNCVACHARFRLESDSPR